MKDGQTHLAHKAEHAVDLDSGAIVTATVQDASTGDTGTMDTLAEAEGQLVKLQRKAALKSLVEGMQEVVADKGYHSGDVILGLEEVGLIASVPLHHRRQLNTLQAPRVFAATPKQAFATGC